MHFFIKKILYLFYADSLFTSSGSNTRFLGVVSLPGMASGAAYALSLTINS